VALVPADDVLKDENVHFIKIDVEGHELQALEGLDKTIHRCRPTLLVEVNECNRKIFTNWLNTKDYQVDAEFKHNQENYEVLILPSERL